MERAPLRPVPARPHGPVTDADAVRTVASALPEIGAPEGLALALVVLGGRERSDVAGRMGLDDAALSDALAAARKALRRTVVPLPGSGWCERAERLVSDRLDDALSERDVRQLDVHLRNCPRCVEHERRLVQATDALVASVAPVAGPPELVEVPAPVEAPPAEAPPAPPAEAPPAEAPPEPPATESEPGEPAPVEPPPAAAHGAAEPAAGAAPGAAATSRAAPRPLRQAAIAVSWHVLFALAVVLAIAALALTVAGFLGVGI